MPQARPLRPISHWRTERLPTFITLMLKSQSFRQFDRLAATGEGKGCLTSGQRTDTGDLRCLW